MPITADDIKAAKAQKFSPGDYADLTDEGKPDWEKVVLADMPDDQELEFFIPANLPSTGIKFTYASAYFLAEKTKPKVNIPEMTLDNQSYFGTIYANIKGGTVTVKQATAVLWEYLGTLKGRLSADWVSFGMKIGSKDTDITARDLLEATTVSPSCLAGSDENPANHDVTKWVMLMLMAPFRINSGLRTEYRGPLMNRLGLLINEISPHPGTFTFSSYLTGKGMWDQDKDYSKVVSALDMFFSKFPEHEDAKLRVCSISARYKDCAALTGVEYLRNLTGTSYGEFMMWIFTQGPADDIVRLFKKGEEIDKADSYLPYIASMKLAAKSPYSASVNPSIHYFIHFTGGLMGQKRSINARMAGDANLLDPLINAMVFAYAKHVRVNWGMKFRIKGTTSVLKTASEAGDDGETRGGSRAEDTPEPENADPRYWYRYILGYGHRIPADIENRCASMAVNITNARKDTIGQYLFNWGTGYLTAKNP